MLKLLEIDTSGAVPYPEVSNPMLDKLKGLKTLGGYRLEGKFPHLTLLATDGYETPPGLSDYFTVGLLNIFSSRLKSALQLVGAELEFFLVTVQYKGEAADVQYYVGNPLNRIKGIDVQKSIVELDEELGDALSVDRLVLDEQKFEGVKFAVVDEINRIAVCQEVVQAIQMSGCTGCSFVEPAALRY